MRISMLILPLALIATPAVAEPVQVPAQLSDPALANRLGDMMEALSKVVLDLRVGEIAAAAEGREPTLADRQRTVRSETGLNERDIEQQVAAGRVAMQQGMEAMAEALPKIADALADAKQQMATAAANMPRPDYPKR